MSEFHNPYAFVPFGTGPHPHGLELSIADAASQTRQLTDWPVHLTHDRFAPGTLSGRLICRVIIKEMLAIGAEQTAGEKGNDRRNQPGTARHVSLFQLGDTFALPGSSLRGLISAIAEAASDSALRVLEDDPLSISVDRNRVPLKHTHAYFPAERRPLALRDGRRSISLAEQLFGVVEDVPEGPAKPQHWQAFTLASRLRFSNALPHALPHAIPAQQGPEVRTPILASPKPMSHNLYYQPTTGPGYIPKGSLHPSQHQANGRKFYLPRKASSDISASTLSPNENTDQKTDIAPLHSGEFWFHIDFDNLTKHELDLLCFSLYPNSSYCHQLGMGKPLGFGQVKLQPMGLFLIDRQARYTKPQPDQRYHFAWRDPSEVPWPSAYQREDTSRNTQPTDSPAARSQCWFDTANSELKPILQALQKIGDPAQLSAPVHYPQAATNDNGTTIESGSPAFERNLYAWWVGNDRPTSAQQYLGALLSTARLPTLKRDTRRPLGAPRPIAPPPPPRVPTRREDLIKGEHLFVVIKAKGDKLVFRYPSEDFYTEGSMADANERRQLLQSGLNEQSPPQRLYVLGIGGGGMLQLRLPLPEEAP